MPTFSGFIRCPDCQKLHVKSGVSPTSNCACGRSLWPVVFNIKPGK